MTDLALAPESFRDRLVGHVAALLRLAWPVMISRAGVLVMAMADVVMVGRYETLALGQLALGVAVFIPALVTGIGAMVGIVSTASRAQGGGGAELPPIALRGLRWGLVVGLLATALVAAAEPLLHAIGHAPALARGGGAVARMLALGALFQIVFVATSFYLEGTGRTLPGLFAMIAANLVNLALNWLLIGGQLGLPELGAPGAALASTIARATMAAGLLAWLLALPEFGPWRRCGVTLWGPGGWAAGAEMRRIGLAGSAAYFFETVAFSSLAQAAGLIGTGALAAYTILHNVEATVFMIALGLSVATAVRVGNAAGAGELAEARFAGLIGLGTAMSLIALIGLALLAFAPQVVAFYSDDAALAARAIPLFVVLCLSMTFDAGQVVMGQATRALGDAWRTTLRFFIAFWGVMVPASLGLAFLTPLAEAGLFIGTALGCLTALALLARRFLALLARKG